MPECTWAPNRALSVSLSVPQSGTYTLSATQYTLFISMMGLTESSARLPPEVVGSLLLTWKASALSAEFVGSAALPKRSVSPFGSIEPLIPDSGIAFAEV